MLDDRLEKIVKRVQKPGRYAGGEWNARAGDWEAVEARMALCYPGPYEIAMSSHLLHILYDRINSGTRFLAERVFAPWADMAAELRREDIRLFSLDSHHPADEFDALCFLLEDELGYPRVLETLDLAGVPVRAAGRTGNDPLVIACGPCTANPEPLAAFIDCFIIGEPEEAVLEILGSGAPLRHPRGSHILIDGGREGLLRRLAGHPGLYIPALHDAVASPRTRVRGRQVAVLAPPPERPVVPFLEVVHNEGMVEVQRGCGSGCAFCETRTACPRLRRRSPAEVIQAIDGLIKDCGYEAASLLVSGAVDLDWATETARAIRAKHGANDLAVEFSTLPVDPRAPAVADILATGRKKRTYTLDLLAASERLREAAGRPVTDEVLKSVVTAIFNRHWESIKVECLLGLPGETLEDVQAIIDLTVNIQELGQRLIGRRPRVRLAISAYIPRPHTLQERAALDDAPGLEAKLEILKRGLKKAGAYATLPDPAAAEVQTCLARGDRVLAPVIERFWESTKDTAQWVDTFNAAGWRDAFLASGIDPAIEARRPRPAAEPLPWAHIEPAALQEPAGLSL